MRRMSTAIDKGIILIFFLIYYKYVNALPVVVTGPASGEFRRLLWSWSQWLCSVHLQMYCSIHWHSAHNVVYARA